MKRVMIALFVLVIHFGCVVNGIAQDDLNSILVEAAHAYELGDYETAIALYETAIDAGSNDSAVYFNLGNAYYESGQLGWALVYYRRAQAISPRDTGINTNIALVRAERLDFQRGEASWLDNLAVSTQDMATLNELGWFTLGLWVLWFLLTALAIIYSDWRRYLRWILTILGVVLFVGLALFSSRFYLTQNRPRAVVIDLSTQVLSGPGEDYLPIFELFAAAEVRILAVHGEWLRFILPDGRQGWVLSSAIKKI